MRRPHLNILLIGGLIAALLAGIGLSHFTRLDSQPDLPGLILNPPREIADFDLRTHDGAVFNKQSAAGRWHLMFFGFTHCPDICPSTLAQMRELNKALPEDIKAKLSMDFVSIDPERDTPELMGPYVTFFDPGFKGITGTMDAIDAFARSLGIAYIKVEQGESYTMDHATALVLLNPKSQVQAYFAAPHKLPELKQTLTALISS